MQELFGRRGAMAALLARVDKGGGCGGGCRPGPGLRGGNDKLRAKSS